MENYKLDLSNFSKKNTIKEAIVFTLKYLKILGYKLDFKTPLKEILKTGFQEIYLNLKNDTFTIDNVPPKKGKWYYYSLRDFFYHDRKLYQFKENNGVMYCLINDKYYVLSVFTDAHYSKVAYYILPDKNNTYVAKDINFPLLPLENTNSYGYYKRGVYVNTVKDIKIKSIKLISESKFKNNVMPFFNFDLVSNGPNYIYDADAKRLRTESGRYSLKPEEAQDIVEVSLIKHHSVSNLNRKYENLKNYMQSLSNISESEYSASFVNNDSNENLRVPYLGSFSKEEAEAFLLWLHDIKKEYAI